MRAKKKRDNIVQLFVRVSANQRQAIKDISKQYGYQEYSLLIDDLVHTYLNKRRRSMAKSIKEFTEGETAVPVQLARNNHRLLVEYCSAMDLSPNIVILSIIRESVNKINKLKNTNIENEDTTESD